MKTCRQISDSGFRRKINVVVARATWLSEQAWVRGLAFSI